MEKLISLKEVIKLAKKEGIDLGKGDPYNRLRYYTKMGWLPHMVRKTNSKGDIEGHYPAWAIDTLKKIQNLKNEGLNNDQVEQKVRTQNNLKRTTLFFTDKGNQKKLVLYSVTMLLVIILLTELNIINIGKNKSLDISKSITTKGTYMIESGTGILPKGNKSIKVATNRANATNRINVTFKDNYSPASRYWVSYSGDQSGFTLETDAPLEDSAEFYWFISN